jgi:murein DD-endopeptidase MepM/ murein hydrolase activator NlpD
MAGKRYLTIQFIPDNAGKIRSITLSYGTIRFLSYLLLVVVLVVSFAVFKFAEISRKAHISEGLTEKNQYLMEKQEKFDSLELEFKRIQQKTKIIENIVQTFLVTDTAPESEKDKKPAETELVSQEQLAAYISIIDSIQKKRGSGGGIPEEFTPLIWPVKGIVTQTFAEKHTGIDIISKPNNLIVSSAKGIVVEAGWRRDLGNTVKINHGGHFSTVYGHLNRLHVNLGDHVSRGKTIGTLGNTGNSTGPHLHYAVSYGDFLMDPLTLIKK